MVRRFSIWLLLGIGLNACAQLESQPNQPAPGYQVDPTRFEADINAFETAQAPQNAIVFIGSSSIRRWYTLSQDMAPLTVVNRGFGGSNMQDAAHFFSRIITPLQPRAIVLYEGDNDLASHGANPPLVMQAFGDFIEQLEAQLPNTRLYVLAIKPSPDRMDSWNAMSTTNVLLHNRCHSLGYCQYIDVASPLFSEPAQLNEALFVEDGIHMNAAGYEIWTSTVKPVLMQHEQAFEEQVGGDQ